MAGNSKRSRGPRNKKAKEIYSRSESVDALNTADILPNPDPIWKQTRTIFQNYQEILWDPHLTAVIASRKAVTLAKNWKIEKEKASDSVTKFVQHAFEQFDVNRSTEEILDCRSLGMQPMEPIWGKSDILGETKAVPIEFTGRPPYWFQYDNENHLRFRSKDNPWPGDEIQPYSLITPRNNPKHDNPYGEALLSKVYWTVNFKKGGFKFWVEYLEKYGSPFIVATPPRTAKDTEFDEFHEKVVEMTKGGAITIPNGAKFDIHNSSSKASGDLYKQLCDFANAEISKAYLGGTLTMDAGDKGARSLGEVHDNVREEFAQSDEILCESCFNELVRYIVDINFGEGVEAPIFRYEHEQDIKGDVAERDTKLHGQGVRFTKDYYKKQYNFTDEDFEMSVEEVTPVAPEFVEPKAPASVAAVNHFLENIPEDVLKEQAEFIDPIIKMIQNEKNYGDAEKKVLGLFEEVRPVLLEQELGNTMFASEMIGRGAND